MLLFSVGAFAQTSQVDLPVTFDEEGVDYGLSDFEGTASTLIEDPEQPGNTVVQTIKGSGAKTFAGTTITSVTDNPAGFATRIPLTADASTILVRVWSPTVGTPVRVKIENASESTVSVETQVLTTVAMAWDTLSFDFRNQAAGTAAVNFASSYEKLTIFFDFDTSRDFDATYYWDDVMLAEMNDDTGGGNDLSEVDFPVTFENDSIDYDLGDFGGAESMIVEDPEDSDNTVVQSTKPVGAMTFAGTTIATSTGFMNRIPVTADASIVQVRVWSPTIGTTVRVKIENNAAPAVSVETNAVTRVAMGWDTLTFDFKNAATGTPAVNYAAVYNKLSIFFDFNSTPTKAATYYWDDVIFTGTTGDGGDGGGDDASQVDLPVTFEDDDINYNLIDFDGTTSTIIEDPVEPGNTVAQTIRNVGGATFAGTTISAAGTPAPGFATRIPITESTSVITMRVWSPAAGVPVRMKIENSNDPTVTVETETLTTVDSTWETLSFDFKNSATNNGNPTAAVNYASTYNKLTVFFNFGAEPTEAATYYWDDVMMAGDTGGGNDNVPTMAAPTPTRDAANVISLFSDAYTDVSVDTWRAGFSNGELEDIQVDGNATKKYTNLNFIGIETTSTPIDLEASNMNTMHLDYWTPNLTELRIKLVDFGGDGSGGASADTEYEDTTSVTDLGQWVSLDIPLSNFQDINKTDINQIILSGFPTGMGTVYIDNVYFYNDITSTNGTPELGLLEAFPNPAIDRMTITAPERMESVTVYSIAGQQIGQWMPNAERIELDMSQYAPGFYVALVVADGRAMTVKFMKK